MGHNGLSRCYPIFKCKYPQLFDVCVENYPPHRRLSATISCEVGLRTVQRNPTIYVLGKLLILVDIVAIFKWSLNQCMSARFPPKNYRSTNHGGSVCSFPAAGIGVLSVVLRGFPPVHRSG